MVMAASSARGDQVHQHLMQTRDADVRICGANGNDFHMIRLRCGDAPGVACRIAVEKAKHAETLHARQKKPRHAGLGTLVARQQHVTPDGLVALLGKTTERREWDRERLGRQLGSRREGRGASISGFF